MSRIPRWIALQLIYGEALDAIERLFTSRGYRFMPVKGAYLIKSGLACSIADRRMRDIDLLVPEEQFEEICVWFTTLDGVEPQPGYWDFERPFLYRHAEYQVYVELHRLVNTPARFLLPNRDLFCRAVPKSESCVFPDPVDVLLIHICHKLLHVIDGFELQFYREIELFAQQYGFSWPEFWIRAERTGVMAFIWLVVQKSNTLLGTAFPLPDVPSWYAAILARLNLFMECRWTVGRRLFFEVPLVRNVLGLLRYKVTHLEIKQNVGFPEGHG